MTTTTNQIFPGHAAKSSSRPTPCPGSLTAVGANPGSNGVIAVCPFCKRHLVTVVR